MKFTNYESIDEPIRLHLEFDQITVGKLSSILGQWQVVLRSAWRESYELQLVGRAPTARVLTVSTSTKHSFDLIAEFVILSTSFLGPIYNWPSLVRTAYGYLGSVWLLKERQSEREDSGHAFIRGVQSAELDVPIDALKDSGTGQRIERLWEIANRGSINITVVPSKQRSHLPSEIRIPGAEVVTVTEDSLQVELSDGRSISVPLAWYPKLIHATQEERDDWEFIGDGQGIRWPDLDEDLSIEGLIVGRPSGES